MNNALKFTRTNENEWFAFAGGGMYHATIVKRPEGTYVSHLYKYIAAKPFKMLIEIHASKDLMQEMRAMEQEYLLHVKVSQAVEQALSRK